MNNASLFLKFFQILTHGLQFGQGILDISRNIPLAELLHDLHYQLIDRGNTHIGTGALQIVGSLKAGPGVAGSYCLSQLGEGLVIHKFVKALLIKGFVVQESAHGFLDMAAIICKFINEYRHFQHP